MTKLINKKFLMIFFAVCCSNFSFAKGSNPNLMPVKNVFIEANGTTSAEAKNAAFASGDLIAVTDLIKKIVPTEKVSYAISLISEKPSKYIFDFAIKEEKITAGRYEAFIDYRIDKDKLFHLLESNNIPLVEREGETPPADFHPASIEKIDTPKDPQVASAEKDDVLPKVMSEKIIANKIKVKVRSLTEWLKLSSVLQKLIDFQETLISSSLVLLDTAELNIDEAFNDKMSEAGFEVKVMSDRTVVLYSKTLFDKETSIEKNFSEKNIKQKDYISDTIN